MVESRPTQNHLPELLRSIEAGWAVEQPLLQRSTSQGTTSRSAVFEVVLSKDGQRRVLALDDDLDTRRFIGEHELAILEV